MPVEPARPGENKAQGGETSIMKAPKTVPRKRLLGVKINGRSGLKNLDVEKLLLDDDGEHLHLTLGSLNAH